jgi:hypothetical protein
MKIANGMDFVNDTHVVGKWEYVDVVDTIDEFDPINLKNPIKDCGFKEIYFLPNGEGYWIFEGWTKGFLCVHYGGDDPILTYKYTIKNMLNNDYIFIEVKNNDEKFVNVLKKVSCKNFKISDFARQENINLPFVMDESVVGKWRSVAYVENIEDFPQNVDRNQTLWLEYIEFKKNGQAIRKYFNQDEWVDKWTNGALLDLKKSVVSKYIIKEIKSVKYMLLEWKMGNYVYASAPATFYVFVKE